MINIKYDTKDVIYGMQKVIEYAVMNDASDLKKMTISQLEDIGHVIAKELSDYKRININSIMKHEDRHVVDFYEQAKREGRE